MDPLKDRRVHSATLQSTKNVPSTLAPFHTIVPNSIRKRIADAETTFSTSSNAYENIGVDGLRKMVLSQKFAQKSPKIVSWLNPKLFD